MEDGDFGCNIQVKRYESDRILVLSVTFNGSSILFNNVYFPVACHEKYEEYNYHVPWYP